MPKFTYIARDTDNKKITGAEEAASPDELISRLQAKNLLVISVVPESTEVTDRLKRVPVRMHIRFRRLRVTQDDLVLFCRQLSILLGSGVAILKCLDVISKQITSKRFYNIIEELKRSMEGGASLREAMAKHPKVFSDLWVNLVESGEASGNLALVLERLANYLERLAAFKRKITSSLMYPAILMLAGIGAFLFMTIKIVPTFAELFKGFEIELPLLTRILIAVSFIMRKYSIVIIGILIVSFFIFRKYTQTKEGRKRFEGFKFRLPMFGGFFQALIVERFTSGMATLVESGVPLLYSLEITEHSVGNLVMADIVHRIKEEIREGKPLNTSLENSRFFEPMLIQMVAIGEEIGELPQMFKRINTFYQDRVETFLNRFTALFEPIMLVVMGLMIGIMVIGMFLPIFQISQLGGK